MTEQKPDCCSSSQAKPSYTMKNTCSVNGIEYREVKLKTVLQHIKRPWDLAWDLDGEARRYFFCDDPDCDVVYFGDDDLIIRQSEVRTSVGVKDKSNDAMLCYCFGVSRGDALRDRGIKDFVKAQTKQGLCACETRNPSGVCCLKNFPR